MQLAFSFFLKKSQSRSTDLGKLLTLSFPVGKSRCKSNQNNPVCVFVFTQAARITLKDLIFITKGMFLNHQDLEHVVSLVQISSSSFAICLTPWLCAPVEIQFTSVCKSHRNLRVQRKKPAALKMSNKIMTKSAT